MAFFVNPPEGVEHGPKHMESKIEQHIYFKPIKQKQLSAGCVLFDRIFWMFWIFWICWMFCIFEYFEYFEYFEDFEYYEYYEYFDYFEYFEYFK